MDFKLSEKIQQPDSRNFDISWANWPTPRQEKMLEAMVDVLTDSEYHELCHQLHGTKSEFDGPDDGEVHRDWSFRMKKLYAIRAAMYRGIFGKTLYYLDVKEDEA